MRNFQAYEGLNLYPDFEKKPQSTPNAKGEGARTHISDMVEFLCSPHRIGRYRQCSLENDVEYLHWLLSGRP